MDDSFAESEDLPSSPEPASRRHQATRNRGKAKISYKEDSDDEAVVEKSRSLKRKTRVAAEKPNASKAPKPRKKRQFRDVGAPLRRNKSCRSQLDSTNEPG